MTEYDTLPDKDSFGTVLYYNIEQHHRFLPQHKMRYTTILGQEDQLEVRYHGNGLSLDPNQFTYHQNLTGDELRKLVYDIYKERRRKDLPSDDREYLGDNLQYLLTAFFRHRELRDIINEIDMEFLDRLKT